MHRGGAEEKTGIKRGRQARPHPRSSFVPDNPCQHTAWDKSVLAQSLSCARATLFRGLRRLAVGIWSFLPGQTKSGPSRTPLPLADVAGMTRCHSGAGWRVVRHPHHMPQACQGVQRLLCNVPAMPKEHPVSSSMMYGDGINCKINDSSARWACAEKSV